MPHDSFGIDTCTVYRWTADVLWSLRNALHDLHFVEILPAILSSRFEPGARHSIAVLGKSELPEIHTEKHMSSPHQLVVRGYRAYYLPVSHAVEKQLAMEHVERAFCITPCVRLLMPGERTSGRHLYSFFQVEIEWRTESIESVFETAEALLMRFSSNLQQSLDDSLPMIRDIRQRLLSLTKIPYPRVTFNEAKAKAVDGQSSDGLNPHNSNDLTNEEENRLSLGFDTPFWIYDYPEGVRDSLYRRNARGYYDTYDLMLPHGFGELFTGGLRPESGEEIIRQSKLLGKDFHPDYAAWKARTNVQSAGFGIGLERLVRFCYLAPSILALRRYHDSGPNATIELGMD